MISQASVNFIHISPRKMRYVIDHIRGKSVRQAQAILEGSPRRGAGIISKLLIQAIDAAKKNSQVEAPELKVSKVLADGGPSMKRFRAMSMGRAGRIRKRTSHIILELDRISGAPVAAPRVPASAKERGGSLPVRQAGASGGKKSAEKVTSAPAAKRSGNKKMAGAK